MIYLVPFVLVLALAGSASAELVLHLPFDEGSGAVTADASASGLQATLEGDYEWTAGRRGQAIAFTDGRAVLSDSSALNLTQITVMAWVNPRSIVAASNPNWYTDIHSIYGKAGSAGDDSIALGLSVEDGVYFYTDTGGNNELSALDAGVSLGQWQHIAGTFDGTTMLVFINGEQVGELAASGNIISNPVLPTIGGRSDTAVSFDGAIDEVRVYDRALTTEEIVEVIRLDTTQPGIAGNPSPADEATDVPLEVVLEWAPGRYADKHDVYFGTVFDDVNDATTDSSVYRGPLSDSSYAVGERLDFGNTYYWRVDEVNAPPNGNVVLKGDVWIFTVEPFAYPIENVTATASSVNRSEEAPENTVNGSGLDGDDLHSFESTAMWLSSGVDPNSSWIQYEFDRVHKLHQMWVWNYNTSVEPLVGFGIRQATIEYSADGVNWSTLGATHEFAQGPGAPGYAPNTIVDLGGVAAKFVKITPTTTGEAS